MKTSYQSVFVEKMFAAIPEDDKKKLMKEKAGAIRSPGDRIRLQSYIPTNVYLTLAYYGAFSNSETEFYTAVSNKWIEEKAMSFGLGKMLMKEEK